jgi:hypothetical protein
MVFMQEDGVTEMAKFKIGMLVGEEMPINEKEDEE